MDRDQLRAVASRELIGAATEVAATMTAAQAALLEMLGVIDERELWRGDGCCSMTDWVSFTFGVARKTAHDWIEAARGLGRLPELAARFGSGELSWDKITAAIAVATPETDHAVAADAVTTEVAVLQRSARRARAVTAAEANEAHRARYLSLRRSITAGGVRLSGFLPDVDGETLIAAIERLAGEGVEDPDTGLHPSFTERCADALVELASAYLANQQPIHGERAMVVAHVDICGDELSCSTGSGMTLAAETIARLVCDGVVEADPQRDGRSLGVPSKVRFPPGWMRRKLIYRDVMCRFPGCTRSRLVHAHHMKHWPKGPTEPPNLLMLCRFHHRKMHEGGWSVRGDANAVVEFVKPTGEVLRSAPPRISDEMKARILGPILPDG